MTSFARDESGATAIEYGLIAALMAVCTIIGVAALSPGVGTLFGGVANAFPDIP